MALWTSEWLSPGYHQNLADLRSAISRRPSSILASRALRRKALILGYCAMRTVGARAGLRKKNAHFLDQPGTKK